MASGFQNMGKIPELRKRLLYTVVLLAVYRIGIFVTTPGVNASVMKKIVNQASGTFLGLFNMFTGGGLEQMSIFIRTRPGAALAIESILFVHFEPILDAAGETTFTRREFQTLRQRLHPCRDPVRRAQSRLPLFFRRLRSR